MRNKIELQPRREQHLARWKQLGVDPELAKLPYKIETDRLGRILMSPPPFFDHVRYVARINRNLDLSAATSDQPGEALDCKRITLRAESADHTRRNARNEGMMTKFFPLVDIGDMDLKDRKFAGVQCVEYG